MEVGYSFATALAFLLLGIGFVFGQLLVGAILRPRIPEKGKGAVYECGEMPVGKAWFNFNPRFYIIALVFVIFEVEIALTIPVALVFKRWIYENRGMIALVEILAFIVILFSGLVWIWARGDLNWVKKLEGEQMNVPGLAAPRSYVQNP